MICFSDPAVVELHPCGHTQFCESCFESYRDTDKSDKCPICRLPILSFTYVRSYSDQISSDCFAQEAKELTKQELEKLNRYVQENPSCFDRLDHCTKDKWKNWTKTRS